MLVSDLVEYLKKFPQDIPVYVSAPVQGDCEALRNFQQTTDIELDDRYPAIVLFPS